MPLYDYQCSACEHEMEALQKMSDAPLTECPACNASTLNKKVTAAAFRLSGSGWYETDFKNGNKKNLTDNGDNKSGDTQNGGNKPASKKEEKTTAAQKTSTTTSSD